MKTAPKEPVGRLEVICGCMFAGKTTELMRRVREAKGAGESVKVFAPKRDTRSGVGRVRTHGGDAIDAVAVATADELLGLAGAASVVAVDEIHFLGAPLGEVCRSLVRMRRRVIVAGVDRDHRGWPFEPFPALFCEADEVVKLSSVCAKCGRPAVHTQRLIESNAAIVVGGAEAYEPRCRECFRPPE